MATRREIWREVKFTRYNIKALDKIEFYTASGGEVNFKAFRKAKFIEAQYMPGNAR